MGIVKVDLDENAIMEICREKIESSLRKLDSEYVFWDKKELMKRTCMSWNFIQAQFFYHPDFPKRKIGNKWFFPTRETRRFLEVWIKQPTESRQYK